MDQQSKTSRFFSLYTSIQGRLYTFLLMMVHNPTEAEELLQETAALLWEQFDRYEEGTNFGAWAITIAKIKATHHLRANRRERLLFKTNLYQQISEVALESSGDVSEHINIMNKCLWKLDKQYRDLLSLRYKKNLSIKEIARMRDKSPGIIYQTLSRLFVVLRRCIKLNLDGGGAI